MAQKVKHWLVGDKCQWGKEDRYHDSLNVEYRIERFLPAAEIFDKDSGSRMIVPVSQLYSNRFGCEDKNAKPLGCDHPKENQKRLDNGVWCDFCGAMFFYGGGWNYPTVMPGY